MAKTTLLPPDHWAISTDRQSPAPQPNIRQSISLPAAVGRDISMVTMNQQVSMPEGAPNHWRAQPMGPRHHAANLLAADDERMHTQSSLKKKKASTIEFTSISLDQSLELDSLGTCSIRTRDELCPSSTFDIAEFKGGCESAIPALGENSHSATINLWSARMLRGTPLVYVLRNGGRILQNNNQSRSMGLQPTIQRIDSFISYNGSIPHNLQMNALILHFNLTMAATITFMCSLSFIALNAFGVLETFEDTSGKTGIMNSVLPVPIFLFVLRFGRDVLHCIRFPGPSVFLDKACVSPSEKEESVRCWGAFLHNSPAMLVIYSDMYLRKLWTVFEVTIFLVLHPRNMLTVLPDYLPTTIVKGTVVAYVVRLLCKILMFPSILLQLGVQTECDDGFVTPDCKFLCADCILYGAHLLIALPFLTIYASSLRQIARERGLMRARIQQDFSVVETQCLYQADRVAINRSICSLMKCLGYVPETATDDEALLSFDCLVKKHVPPALEARMGGVGVPYKYVLMILQADLWTACDRIAGLLQDHCEQECYKGDCKSTCSITLLRGQEIGAYSVFAVTTFFIVGPLTLLLMFHLAQSRLALKGCAEKIHLVAGALGSMAFYGLLNYFLDVVLRERAKTSIVFFCIFCAVSLSLALVCFMAYRFPTLNKPRQRPNRSTMHSVSTWRPLVGPDRSTVIDDFAVLSYRQSLAVVGQMSAKSPDSQ